MYALRRLEWYQEALDEADAVLAVYPGDAGVRWQRLLALSGRERWEELRRDSELALADDHLAGRHQFEFLHAMALVGLGESDDALREFDALIDGHPDYVDPALRKVELLRNLDRVDEALAAADAALETNGNNAGVVVRAQPRTVRPRGHTGSARSPWKHRSTGTSPSRPCTARTASSCASSTTTKLPSKRTNRRAH